MATTVTVGVDGSPESLAAADWAAREALRRDLPLHIVHAWDWQPYAYTEFADDETHRHWAQRIPYDVQEGLLRRYPDLRITFEQLADAPVQALLAAAATAELLAIGSRGISGLEGFLLGSVALPVVARARRPVVLVRAGARPQDEHRPQHRPQDEHRPDVGDAAGQSVSPYRDVLLGLDLERSSDALIEFAFRAAAARAAALRVVHTWTLPPVYAYGAAIDIGIETAMAEDRQAALADVLLPWREKFPDVEVIQQALMGRAADHLANASAGASLVVVGRRNRRPLVGPSIGPVAHAALHHCVAPVAVVPHD